jgi:hypothetical protein
LPLFPEKIALYLDETKKNFSERYDIKENKNGMLHRPQCEAGRVILHYMCNEVAARGELLVLPQRVPHLGS